MKNSPGHTKNYLDLDECYTVDLHLHSRRVTAIVAAFSIETKGITHTIVQLFKYANTEAETEIAVFFVIHPKLIVAFPIADIILYINFI